MRTHRNPRPRLAKRPATDNLPRRARQMRATFCDLVRQNPRLATAVLAVLEIVASADRQRARRLIEAASTVVLASPRRAS